MPILKSVGALVLFSGSCAATFIGGAAWDRIILVGYPDKTTLWHMAWSDAYHREASLEGYINLAVFEDKPSPYLWTLQVLSL